MNGEIPDTGPKKPGSTEHPPSAAVGIISSDHALIRALVFALVVFGLLLSFAFLVLGNLKRFGISEVKITDSVTISVNGGDSQSTSFLYHPSGWNRSDIVVKAGDEIVISASGRVNLALGSRVRLYNQVNEVAAPKNGVRQFVEALAADELCKIQKQIPSDGGRWRDATGLEGEPQVIGKDLRSECQPPKRGKVSRPGTRPISEQVRQGALLLYITDGDNAPCPALATPPPEHELIGYKGVRIPMMAYRSGLLCFIINDLVAVDGNPVVNDVLWLDNDGFLSLRLKISR